jgi:hypothetical protein
MSDSSGLGGCGTLVDDAAVGDARVGVSKGDVDSGALGDAVGVAEDAAVSVLLTASSFSSSTAPSWCAKQLVR